MSTHHTKSKFLILCRYQDESNTPFLAPSWLEQMSCTFRVTESRRHGLSTCFFSHCRISSHEDASGELHHSEASPDETGRPSPSDKDSVSQLQTRSPDQNEREKQSSEGHKTRRQQTTNNLVADVGRLGAAVPAPVG